MTKSHIGYTVGTAVAAAMVALTLFSGHFIPAAHAQLTANEMFGGNNGDANNFAASAGLGSGDLTATIASFINVVLGFLGIVAVVIIMLGGFKWMTAGGNDDKVKEAKKLMIAGVIGLIIVLASYSIAYFVVQQITNATTAA